MKAPKYGTIERKIDMMKYICLQRYTTMPKLADMFGVSTRTVIRDLADIGDFIPIITQQGRYEGGVSVDKDFSWDRAYMSDADVSLLIKVIQIGKCGAELKLDDAEICRLDKIINTYKKPEK